MEKEYYQILKNHILKKDVDIAFIVNEIVKDFQTFTDFNYCYNNIEFKRLLNLLELIYSVHKIPLGRMIDLFTQIYEEEYNCIENESIIESKMEGYSILELPYDDPYN